MLTKEAQEQAYMIGVDMALEEAGLSKIAGMADILSKGSKLLGKAKGAYGSVGPGAQYAMAGAGGAAVGGLVGGQEGAMAGLGLGLGGRAGLGMRQKILGQAASGVEKAVGGARRGLSRRGLDSSVVRSATGSTVGRGQQAKLQEILQQANLRGGLTAGGVGAAGLGAGAGLGALIGGE